MNKKGGFFSNFILFILLIALGFCGYYLYLNFPGEPVSFNNFNLDQDTTIVQNNLPSKQFYERMRYQDRIIKYHISESCSQEKASSMKEALDTIESKTIISFNPVQKSSSELKILCSDVSPEAGQEDHFVAGEGGPSRVIDSTLYSVILEGEISLFREGQCENPNVAIHELLHALGFDHNNDRNSILYPTLDCNQEIDKEIIDSIDRLYSQDSVSDLLFSAASATKSGRYLNFHIEVLNQGLKLSNPIKVSIYADSSLIEDFELNEISIGAKKILDVENLKIPSNSKKIDFVIDEKNELTEIDENNNKVSLNILS